MEQWWSQDRRLTSAVLASLFLHALVAFFLPNWQTTNSSPDSVEVISFTRIAHVSVRAPRPAAAAHATVPVAKTPTAPRRVERAAKPHRKAARLPGRGKPTASPPPASANASKQFSVAKQDGTPLPQFTAAPSTVAAAPVQTAAPAAQPKQQDRQVARSQQGNTNSGGTVAFLTEQDPALDENVHKELQRRFKFKLQLVVYVSEDGKTQRVEFHPPMGADIEKQIRDVLKDAHWDAAVCGGGITCDGKVTITLTE